jgi:PAS domain S-box-containing protein
MSDAKPSERPRRHRLTAAASILRSRMAVYCGLGFGFGLALTLVGYLVDYYTLYRTLPESLSLSMIRGLHQVTPIHYFMDGFAPILAAVGALAGRFHDRLRHHSNHLEEIVTARTEALRGSQERYELAARGSNDGLWDWDLVAGTVYYSPRWSQGLGLEPSAVDAVPGSWFDRVHSEDRRGLEARIETHLAGGTEHLAAEFRMRHSDGSYRWMLARGIAVRDPATGRPQRLAGSQADIDERKRMEEQLMHLALHDPLTDLPNRTLFFDRLSRAFARARRRRRDESLAIVFVDIDRFKNINDSLGHAIGDHVLREVARRFRERVERAFGSPEGDDGERPARFEGRRRDWTIARMGGDEFTLLLQDIDSLREVTQAARQLEEEFRQPVTVEGRELFVTLSTGIVLGPGRYERAEDLLRDADTAMYRAKARGRARCEIFDERMLEQAQEQLRLETDLHLALEREEFHLVYQPIIELEGNRLRGFEALLRWQHPEKGLIPPAKFIPLAEEIGLIVPLGNWAFTEACRRLRQWHDLDARFQGLTLAMNLSLRQIYSAELEEEIVGLVHEAGLDPTLLHFEITENTLIEHPKQVTSVLMRLKKRGFKVAIDDFGTGYSSLAALQTLPVDLLKIDQGFIARMGESEKGSQIVATIVGLANALGHEVIAEGIETESQVRELRRLRCPLGQGHLFSPALEGDRVESEILARYYEDLEEPGRRPAGLRRAS